MNKAHVLQEIKRTAKVNGGIALGWRKFESETGIKECEWLGKFWARWSDAFLEAGFTPNQLQGAYDKSVLKTLTVFLSSADAKKRPAR